MKLILLLSLLNFSNAIWWWFSAGVDSNNDLNEVHTNGDMAVAQIFAPFEISTGEQKFLIEAQHYLQNLPMLDQCNLLVGLNKNDSNLIIFLQEKCLCIASKN